MTERQIESWSIGIKTAVTIAIFLVFQTAFVVGQFWALKGNIAEVSGNVDAIQKNQEESKQRADERQDETQNTLSNLDARIRPLETQSAATVATLQGINANLTQQGADQRAFASQLQTDLRDLRQALEGKGKTIR